jgi:tetratricopeptide (TPR) repeat protein
LSHDDSVGLLRRIVGDRRVDAEFDAAERLADLCGRLPLVLRITAANLASHDEMGLAQYVAQLSGPERLNRLAVEGDPAAAASPMFDVSFSALIPADQRLLATLSLIPGDDFCDDLVASMIDRNPTETASALGRLTSAHLVENYRPARYRLHDLVREYALRQARRVMAEEGRHAARSRFIHWYFHNRNQLRPEEGANVIAALKTWLGEPDTWRLAVSLSGFRSAEFQSSELLRLAQDELPMARESGDTQGIALLCVTVATLLSYTGDRASAITYAQEAVNVAPEDPDGHFHANLAILLLQVGRYADAEPVLRTALAAATTNGNQRLIQSCTSMLANTLRIRGDWDEAEKLLLPLASPKNELPSRIGALLHLAETLGDRGRESEVSPVLDEALAIASNSPDIRHKALTLIIRAAHLDRIGSAGLAHQDLTEALNLAEQGERAVLTYDVRLVRAELLSNSGKQDEATSELDLLPHNDSDPALTAELSRLRCLVHTRRRDFVRAVEFGQRAREIYGAMRYPLRLARTLELLSDAYNGAGDSIRAKECHGAAQKVFLNLGLAVTEAQTED